MLALMEGKAMNVRPHSKTNAPAKRLERMRETERYIEEVELASAFLRACPELTYGEALRHAFAKLRREGKR